MNTLTRFLTSISLAFIALTAPTASGASSNRDPILVESERENRSQVNIVAEAVSPTQFATQVLSESPDFKNLYNHRYLYYMNTLFETENEENLRVSIWLRGVDFNPTQNRAEKRLRLCGFLAQEGVTKTYRGSFDEEDFGPEFALAFFNDLCESPLKRLAAFEECQARQSRSYLRWQEIKPACEFETTPKKE